MNANRRKAIAEAVTKLKSISEEINTLLQDEQEYYDNMPESIQNGQKGEAAQQACDHLQEAIESTENAVNELESYE